MGKNLKAGTPPVKTQEKNSFLQSALETLPEGRVIVIEKTGEQLEIQKLVTGELLQTLKALQNLPKGIIESILQTEEVGELFSGSLTTESMVALLAKALPSILVVAFDELIDVVALIFKTSPDNIKNNMSLDEVLEGILISVQVNKIEKISELLKNLGKLTGFSLKDTVRRLTQGLTKMDSPSND